MLHERSSSKSAEDSNGIEDTTRKMLSGLTPLLSALLQWAPGKRSCPGDLLKLVPWLHEEGSVGSSVAQEQSSSSAPDSSSMSTGAGDLSPEDQQHLASQIDERAGAWRSEWRNELAKRQLKENSERFHKLSLYSVRKHSGREPINFFVQQMSVSSGGWKDQGFDFLLQTEMKKNGRLATILSREERECLLREPVPEDWRLHNWLRDRPQHDRFGLLARTAYRELRILVEDFRNRMVIPKPKAHSDPVEGYPSRRNILAKGVFD